ncbi:MAG: hypothetical protein IPP32_01440 [Bacteroidetes bacterium]|nr:hypothetical protein [Bacteroidota bacterium]
MKNQASLHYFSEHQQKIYTLKKVQKEKKSISWRNYVKVIGKILLGKFKPLR